MTLKEVKRAQKKDPGGFKFTPSQLARADRQDAQEEKRRKALDKERQREDNKRKREEKAEKDRAVRRRMLDEGRITLEDTWGKVTSSQPRLNKFFAQPAQPSSKPSRLSNGITTNDTAAENHSCHHGEEPPSANDNDEQTPSINDVTALRASSQSTLAHSTTVAISLSISGAEKKALSSWSQPSTMKELRKSELNSRASKSPPREKHISQAQRHQQTQTLAQRNQTLPENGLASTYPDVKVSENHAEVFTDPLHCGNGYDTEDDFTDELDDETLVMLCSTQKAREPYEGEGFKGTVRPLSFASPKAKKSCCMDKHNEASKILDGDSDPAVSKQPTESFSAVFNEIEDGDFIALAEQIEADLTSELTLVRQDASNSYERKVNRSVLHEPIRKHSANQILLKTESATSSPSLVTDNVSAVADTLPRPPIQAQHSGPQVKAPMAPPPQRRKRRILPWNIIDEFDTPGPSTQAIMLECVVEAEAKIDKFKST